MLRRAASLLALTAACGSRTSLAEGQLAGDTDDVRDASIHHDAADARADAAPAPRDADVPDGPPCSNDRGCDDGLPCTLDRCDLAFGRCRFEDTCPDALLCNGVERCEKSGCALGTPPSCDDGIACTGDTCDEGAKGCAHRPDDSLCPPPELCDTVAGCANFAYACSSQTLYEVALPAGTLRAIGPTGTALYDIALHPNGTLYGVGAGTPLFAVDRGTGAVTPSGNATPGGFNGMDVAPSGDLYASGSDGVWKLDLATGKGTLAALFPTGLSSSGDMAFVAGSAFATARGGGTSDELVLFDLGAGTSRVVGSIGFSCVYGLAEFSALLYGFTCDGIVLRIDTTTGTGTELARSSTGFYGASAR